MSILGRGPKDETLSYGDRAVRLILVFLKNTEGLKVSAYTFTELFSFVFFLIDSVLFTRRISSREVISKNIIESYDTTMKSIFTVENEKLFIEYFNLRMDEYASMFKARKEPFDILEKADFYLNQSSGADEFFKEGSPLLIEGFTKIFSNKMALNDFYLKILIPFIETIIQRES
jgi:hypothetical protein